MNYGGYIVRLYLRQSGRIGRDAKTIGASYVVLVHAYKEGATEEIVGSNPTSDTKITHREWNKDERNEGLWHCRFKIERRKICAL